jgi:hypothetical protein
LRCSAPTSDDIADAYKKHGLHTERFIKVYGNALAMTALPQSTRRLLPEGAIIAKEKLLQAEDSLPDGVAFMIKRNDPRFRDSGGWEFLYFPQTGHPADTHRLCAVCHRGASSRDYVFADYPAR